MTLRPNRLFYGLPLLLFAWAAPDLSAQTWTTVWTPDSAPAQRATSTGGKGTHLSSANCYPCKEWEDYGNGNGKWVFDPAGTEPAQCPGYTFDFSCKECDGNGGVRNKDDGTDCSTSSIKDGCCQGGECTSGRHLADCADMQNCGKLVDNPDQEPSVTDPPCGPIPWLGISALPDYCDDCCEDHDRNYSTCESDKTGSDAELYLCILGKCSGMSGNFNTQCTWWANRVKGFFSSGGGYDQWCAAQAAACNCCD